MALKLCNSNSYIKTTTLETSLKGLLGLSCIKWYSHGELDPYVLAIMDYLNSKLLMSGACTILQMLQEFTGLYEKGSKMIIDDQVADLAFLVGIDTGDPEYREELFTFVWGMFMSSLYMQLMYNYAGVFDDSAVSKGDCHSGCHSSECGTGLNSSNSNSSLGGTGNWQLGNYDCGCNK